MAELPRFPDPPYTDYTSPPLRPGLVSRLMPTAAFYSRVARIVFASSWEAKKGRFADAEWYEASRKVRIAFEKVGCKIQVRGTEHLAHMDQPCVIIGNHMSTAETFLLATAILPHMPVTFVVKQSLVEYPVFKHVMRTRDPIVVGRVNPRDDLKAVLGGGQERLKEGTSIVIFPQRTRTVQFDREAFNTIGIKLAKRAQVPVIPLALKTNAWSNGEWFKDYGRFQPQEDVHFEFGEPMQVAPRDRETHEAVMDFIQDRLRAWGL